jgi:capsular exopolysaccharide synthesis family protein
MSTPTAPVTDIHGEARWHRPRLETPGLQRYLQTLRERFRLIVGTLLVTTAAAVGYLAVTEKVYEAEADLLVTPVSRDDPLLTGLGLIRESSDPTRDVETAARLVTTRNVAARVKRRLRLDQSTRSLLAKVDAAPVAQSNIVSVTAEESSPRRARDVADEFARGVVADRTAKMRSQIDAQIPGLRRRVASGGGAGETGPDSPASQLARLESLRDAGDPTLRVETLAEVPGSASSPKTMLTLFAGALAGLVLGVGGAFAMHALDPRLRREEQLRELYSLPVLARIPRERRARTTTPQRRRLFGIGPHRRRRRALAPGQLSPPTLESFRTLRTMLAATRGRARAGRSVLVTGPSPSEGKTTTAINLAASFALAGNRVILIEADFRRPTVGEALGIRPQIGIAKVLLSGVPLEEALVPAKPFGDHLRTLLVDRADDWLAEALSLPAARSLLEEAERLADYVVIDSPPLTEVIDALPIASQVDDVLLVVRLGSSNLSQLQRLGDLLAQNAITPTGFVIVGVGTSEESTYYVAARRERAAEDTYAREGAESVVEAKVEQDGGASERERLGSVEP